MKNLAPALLVLGAMAASPATADTLFCDSCTQIQQRSMLNQRSNGNYYIYDNNSGAISKWIREQDCSGGSCLVVITKVAAEQIVVNYASFYRTNNYHSIVLPSGSYPNDAYEGVQFPQLSRNVGTFIKNGGYGFVQDYLNFVAGLGSIIGFNLQPMDMTIRVNYADGSTALYAYNHTTQTWDRLKGESRDSNNNLIPETKDAVSGGGPGTTTVYYFTGPNGSQNLIDFINLLGQLGVPISGPTSNRTAIVCVSDSKGTYCESGN